MENLINLKKAIEEISTHEGWLYAKIDIDTEDDAEVFFYNAGSDRSPKLNYKQGNHLSDQDFSLIFRKKI